MVLFIQSHVLMSKIKEEKLETIVGGSSSSYISGPIINAFVNVIKLLMEAGTTLGSSIRRIAEDNVCPL